MLRVMQNNRTREPLTFAQRAICGRVLHAAGRLCDAARQRARRRPLRFARHDRRHAAGGAARSAAARLLSRETRRHAVPIALENGQNYRDIAAWNNLANPNQIEVDQLLRVAPPGGSATAGAPVAAPIGGAAVTTAPLSSGRRRRQPVRRRRARRRRPRQPAMARRRRAVPSFAWPVRGPVLNGFDDAKNKGVNIGGTAGEAVKAAADGRVVYSGNGLRGYGNLVIIKHDATYLTAYAHNAL
jgi:lipoprotein NlpD